MPSVEDRDQQEDEFRVLTGLDDFVDLADLGNVIGPDDLAWVDAVHQPDPWLLPEPDGDPFDRLVHAGWGMNLDDPTRWTD